MLVSARHVHSRRMLHTVYGTPALVVEVNGSYRCPSTECRIAAGCRDPPGLGGTRWDSRVRHGSAHLVWVAASCSSSLHVGTQAHAVQRGKTPVTSLKDKKEETELRGLIHKRKSAGGGRK